MYYNMRIVVVRRQRSVKVKNKTEINIGKVEDNENSIIVNANKREYKEDQNKSKNFF